MKRKAFMLVLMATLLVVSFTLNVFAATEELDITPSTLSTLNGADDKEGADAAKGDTYQNVGDWHWTGGSPGNGSPDYALPFDEGWTHSGTEAHILFMNYDGYILIAKDIDLGKYSKAVISYSTDASFSASENEIGFFAKPASFGFGEDRKTDGLIASGKTTPADGENWNTQREMEIELNTAYKGDLYLAHYMKEANGVCVTNIEFTLREADNPLPPDAPSDPTTPADPADPTEPPKTGDVDVILMLAAVGALAIVLKKRVTA